MKTEDKRQGDRSQPQASTLAWSETLIDPWDDLLGRPVSRTVLAVRDVPGLGRERQGWRAARWVRRGIGMVTVTPVANFAANSPNRPADPPPRLS